VVSSLLFLVFIILAHVETARQFLPFIRLDGYYILSDLAGVPNLFSYMRPALVKATTFWRKGDHHAHRTRPLEALTRRTQVVLIIWACVTGPVLAFHIGMLVVFLPQIAGAAWGSAGVQLGLLGQAIGTAELLAAATALVGLVFLLLPTAGISYIVVRRLNRVSSLVQRWWGQRPALTAAAVTAVSLAVALHIGLAWPDKFTEAASAPGRERAEATAAESGAEARARVSRSAEAVTDVVSRVTPGGPSPEPPPPVVPPAGPVPGEDGSDGSPRAGRDPSPDGRPSRRPAPAPAPNQGPASTAPGAPRPPAATTPPPQAPAPTTTAPPGLPSLEETVDSVLSVLETE
jgi:putative peptide zinc metalloprotease protein